jgi:hypothetical protein
LQAKLLLLRILLTPLFDWNTAALRGYQDYSCLVFAPLGY